MDSLTNKMLELDDMLFEKLNKYGFKKKKKHVFRRSVGECQQHISILETKQKGKEEVHISICVGFTYEKINKIISFLQNEKYDKKWATANINISALIGDRKPYGFYISESTDLNPIVQDIVYNIEKYSLSFLDSCDNLEKYEDMLLEKNEKVRNSTYTLKRPEWNLLALSILLHNNEYKIVLENYKEDFEKNMSLLQVAKDRIMKFDVIKESEKL